MTMGLFWLPVMIAGAVSGATTATLGVYLVGMRIPFLGICVAHAAMAGAVFGRLMGGSTMVMNGCALAAATTMAVALGYAMSRRMRIDSNATMSMLFSLTMGLAFLGMGLFDRFGQSDGDVRSLLWGSILFCGWRDAAMLCAIGAVVLVFVAVCFKELSAILFSRELAEASGLRTTTVWTAFLILTAVAVTASLQTVGGLMIYSLLANPAAAAFQLVKTHRNAVWLSAAIGAASAVGGFLISAAMDLPTGAVIVITSSLAVGVAAILRKIGCCAA